VLGDDFPVLDGVNLNWELTGIPWFVVVAMLLVKNGGAGKTIITPGMPA
jgi:hypothetical protein